MDWTQAFTIMGVFIGAFLYLMSRMDANQKHMNEKLDSNQKQNNEKFDMINQRFNSLENKVNTLEVEIKAEMRNMNQRLSTIEGYLVPRKIFRIEEIDPKDQAKDS